MYAQQRCHKARAQCLKTADDLRKMTELVFEGHRQLEEQRKLTKAAQNMFKQSFVHNKVSSAMMEEEKEYDAKSKRRNQRKTKKKKMRKSFADLESQCDPGSSYDPSPLHRGRRHIDISKRMTRDIVPSVMGGSDWFKFMEKAIAMQMDDYPLNMGQDMMAIHFDFCDSKTEEPLYCIVEKQDPKEHRGFARKMHDGLFTANDIKAYSMEIPISSQQKFQGELARMDEMKRFLMQSPRKAPLAIGDWRSVKVFARKNKKYNKERMVLYVQDQTMNDRIHQFRRNLASKMTDLRLVPMVMFNGNSKSHWIEWLWIVRIAEDTDIGIALNHRMEVTGIHLDKEYILEQHHLVCPRHIAECTCLDDWKSSISDIKIFHDLNEETNKMNDYKQKYYAMKLFLHEFIEAAPSDEYQSYLQQYARLLVGGGDAVVARSRSHYHPQRAPRPPPFRPLISVSSSNASITSNVPSASPASTVEMGIGKHTPSDQTGSISVSPMFGAIKSPSVHYQIPINQQNQ